MCRPSEEEEDDLDRLVAELTGCQPGTGPARPERGPSRPDSAD
jgi:hypothetical protein